MSWYHQLLCRLLVLPFNIKLKEIQNIESVCRERKIYVVKENYFISYFKEKWWRIWGKYEMLQESLNPLWESLEHMSHSFYLLNIFNCSDWIFLLKNCRVGGRKFVRSILRHEATEGLSWSDRSIGCSVGWIMGAEIRSWALTSIFIMGNVGFNFGIVDFFRVYLSIVEDIVILWQPF